PRRREEGVMKATKPLLELTAGDVMIREVVTIPQEASLRSAARILLQANVSGAPVTDELGRCVGVLSAFDFLRHVEGACQEEEDRAPGARPCPYLIRGHPACGWDGWVCVLEAGGCPYQGTRPTTG